MLSQLLLPGDVFPHVNTAAIKQTSIGDYLQRRKFNAIISEEVAGHRLEAKNGDHERTIEDDEHGLTEDAAGNDGMKGEIVHT